MSSNMPLGSTVMPLKIAVAWVTWCQSGIYQSGDRRRNRPLYTMAVGCKMKAQSTLCYPLSTDFTWCGIKWQMPLWQALWQTSLELSNNVVYTWTARVYKGLFLHLLPLWQMPLWHQVAHDIAILCGIISLCTELFDVSLCHPSFLTEKNYHSPLSI